MHLRHPDDIEAQCATIDWLREMDLLTLIETAKQYRSRTLLGALDDMLSSHYDDVEPFVIALADKIDAARREADGESRAEISAMWREDA